MAHDDEILYLKKIISDLTSSQDSIILTRDILLKRLLKIKEYAYIGNWGENEINLRAIRDILEGKG